MSDNAQDPNKLQVSTGQTEPAKEKETAPVAPKKEEEKAVVAATPKPAVVVPVNKVVPAAPQKEKKLNIFQSRLKDYFFNRK